MRDYVKKLAAKGWVAHLIRAHKRFENRLGNQFAGAVTYFSVLALVPILMLGFAALGMTITVLRPDMLDMLKGQIQAQMNGAAGGDSVAKIVDSAFSAWRSIGIIGLASAAYAGAGWMANLKSAVRAQWTPATENEEKKRFIVLEVLVNFGLLLGVLVISLVIAGGTTVGTGANEAVLKWLGFSNTWWARFTTSTVTFMISVAAAWALFLFLYRVLPQQRAPWPPLWRGALGAALAFALLQMLTGRIVGLFAKNPAAAVFGPIITLMLFFNVFARLTLFVAAWIATHNQPAVAYRYNECDLPLRAVPASEIEVAEGHWEYASADKENRDAEAAGEPRSSQAVNPDSARAAWLRQRRELPGPVPPGPDPTMVPKETAAQGVRAGMGAGYAVGIASGAGLGALLLKLARRRQPRP